MLPLSLEIVAIITVLIGIIVNGYILLIVTFTKQIAYVNKLLLLHLGVVNTLICFTYLTFYVMSLLNLLVLVDIACIIFGLSFNIMHSVALWNLCALNFDRYFAIASPLHYGALINTKKVLIGLGCGWIVSIFFALPQLLQVSPYHYDSLYEFCLPNFKTTGSLVYNTSLTAFTIFLPIILIFGCNMKVLMIARYQRHRIASAILEVTLSAQLTITHQRNPFFIPSFTSAVQNPTALKIHTHSPVSNIFQLVGSIILIYCPYYFCNLWNNIIEAVRTEEKHNVETDLLIPKIVFQISATLLLLSPFVNALLYGIKNKIIRKSFHNFWRKQKSKIEIHYEIQARTPSTCGSRRPSINGTNSAQPLLHRQLSETFLEISKADINNIQSDIKLRSESLWSSNSKLSSYSVLNSPIGNQTTSSLTPGPTSSTNEPKFVYLNPASTSSSPPPPPTVHEHPVVPSTSGSSKITCNIRSAVRHYSTHNTKPKIKITKTYSEEKQPSPVHGHPLDDTDVKVTPKNTKSLFNLGQTTDDNLTVDATVEPISVSSHSKPETINFSPFKKYSSLQEISIASTTATICDILK